jgi:hypothetical protein
MYLYEYSYTGSSCQGVLYEYYSKSYNLSTSGFVRLRSRCCLRHGSAPTILPTLGEDLFPMRNTLVCLFRTDKASSGPRLSGLASGFGLIHSMPKSNPGGAAVQAAGRILWGGSKTVMRDM